MCGKIYYWKMLEPVINTSPCSYCLEDFHVVFQVFNVLMDFYYFAFVHYILITIIFFSCSAHLLSQDMETPGKRWREGLAQRHWKRNKRNGIDRQNVATNRHLEQEKRAERRRIVTYATGQSLDWSATNSVTLAKTLIWTILRQSYYKVTLY